MPTLKTFQQEGVDFLRENDYRALLADAPGTGKTVQILTALANDRRKLTPMLVIAPASVTQNWQDEARVWAPWARTYVISDETTPIPSIRLDIIICSWGLLASRLRRLAKLRPKFLVVDEAHFAKNEEALRSRAIGTARPVRSPSRAPSTAAPASAATRPTSRPPVPRCPMNPADER
jgi:SNF2 family DNA or RNA helicase